MANITDYIMIEGFMKYLFFTSTYIYIISM